MIISRPMLSAAPTMAQAMAPAPAEAARQPTVKPTLMVRPTVEATHFSTGPCLQFSTVT